MLIIFHEAFHESFYSEDPYDNAAVPDRLVGMMDALRDQGRYEVRPPEPATRADLLRGHSAGYIDSIETRPLLFNMASLAAGAALLGADLALRGDLDRIGLKRCFIK